MGKRRLKPAIREKLRMALGYLNFSSGKSDPQFLDCINLFYDSVADDVESPWRELYTLMQDGLEELQASDSAFQSALQAEQVLPLVFEKILPTYRSYHQDLLGHQPDEILFAPFFIGRVFEAVLAEGGPWDDTERITYAVIHRLSDYVGYRPLPVLEGEHRHQTYSHERVRPIPLYIEGVGVASGKYQTLITQMLEILRATSPDLLRDAYFDPDMLQELAMDPREFDFDHPVNRRPNYHFGLWDPDLIDNGGYYRRFVLHQVTLDGLLHRIEAGHPNQRKRLTFEAAGVLAGTMLMGSGVSGDGPEAHSSEVTLGTLMPIIADYRDRFYAELLDRAPEKWQKILRKEEQQRRQPFGGVRQELNRYMAQCRAEQLARVTLARLYAQIGYPEAAEQQAEVVAVASTRMRCEIDCRILRAQRMIDEGRLDDAAALLPEIDAFLLRAIDCGAFVDPWNILAFGAQFSLFPAIENTVHDHRIDDLLDLMNSIFRLFARLEKEAAAVGNMELHSALSDRLSELAEWWDQYASTEVSGIEGFSGEEAWRSTMMVSTALRAWHQAGTAAGDVRFWSKHVERFDSPKAYALVVDALLDQRDLVASMALLMRWLSEAPEVRLSEGDYSFHSLAVRWMNDLWELDDDRRESFSRGQATVAMPSDKVKHIQLTTEERWSLTQKFLDFLEANADTYWDVPELDLDGVELPPIDFEDLEELEEAMEEDEEPDDEIDELFRAAYENVTYHDTTDDGVESNTFESSVGPVFGESDYELSSETDRISERLAFLITVAKLWKFGAVGPDHTSSEQREVRKVWLDRALSNWETLLELLEEVDQYDVPTPEGTTDALLEYDRHRGTKEILVDRIIWTCVEMADSVQLLQATLDDQQAFIDLADWEKPVAKIFQAIFQGNAGEIKNTWPDLLAALGSEPLLYIPTSRGGDPLRIVASRCLQQILSRLLEYVPRMGLLTETFQLLETIHHMEQDHPVGPGAITEFDHLFEIGCKGIIECLVESSETWDVQVPKGRSGERQADLVLVECVERATELMLRCWLAHSRGIRISVLESVAEEKPWSTLRRFIETYGSDLFTQQFMNFGNLRAILHEGVDLFLDSLLEMPEPEIATRLIQDIESGQILMEDAVNWLELALEAVAENYSEYIDYNSTTTQSDRGELLYTFLDFLRLQSSYDRVAWNLKPVFLAHEVLVRRRRNSAAALWQSAVARRSMDVADTHIQMYEKLSKQYGMWLPCVSERLKERFVRPLQIDRMCAMLRPAIEESGKPTDEQFAFERLYEMINEFLSEPSSVGFEIPSWLESLQNELMVVRQQPFEDREPYDPTPRVPHQRLSMREVYRQMEEW